MDYIRQAVQRARASRRLSAMEESQTTSAPPVPASMPFRPHQIHPANLVELDRDHLESKRIIAHDISDPRSTAFDMLRTQVLLEMAASSWHMLAITSPTPGCGKTLTAINLALSIARQPETAVLLVDLDLRRPQIAACLGIAQDKGIISTVRGETPLPAALIRATIDRYGLTVLIAERATQNASELVGSRNMTALLQSLKRDFGSHIVILDMPPLLSTDDALRLLPQIDCALLVAAVGISTTSDIEACKRHLHSAHVIRVVLNKTRETATQYYY